MAESNQGDPPQENDPEDPVGQFGGIERDPWLDDNLPMPPQREPSQATAGYAGSADDPEDVVSDASAADNPFEPRELPASFDPRQPEAPLGPLTPSLPPIAATEFPPLPPPGTFAPPPVTFGPPAGFGSGLGAPPPSPPPPVSPFPPPPPPDWRANPPEERFPAWLTVEHRPQNRVTTFLRLPMLIPLVFLLYALTAAAPFLLFVARAGTLFRRKHPVWVYSGLGGFLAWHARLYGYALLLTDQYPSFSSEPNNAVKAGYDVPEQGTFSRWNGLIWRSVVLVPHYFVLGIFFGILVPILTVIAWFAILVTGQYPRGVFNWVAGVVRWWFRVLSYQLLLHDRFPPFSTSAAAVRGSQGAFIASAATGSVVAGGFLTAVIAGLIAQSRPYEETVSYARLVDGDETESTRIEDPAGDLVVTLAAAYDPGDDFVPILTPTRRERVVVFLWEVENERSTDELIDGGVAWLTVDQEDDDGDDVRKTHGARIVTVANTTPPVRIAEGGFVEVYAVFVLPEEAEPVSLRFRMQSAERPVRYEFDD